MDDNDNNLYDELDRAQAKLIMIRDSCDAISHAETYHADGKRFSHFWFEGTAQVCREIITVLDNVLDMGVKPPEA